MLHFLSSTVLIIVFCVFLQISDVAALERPRRSRQATEISINVDRLNISKTYVCPSVTNTLRRQTNAQSSETITIAIPLADVAQLWQELEWIVGQLKVTLQAEGLLPVTAAAVGSATTIADLLSVPPVLQSPAADTGNPFLTNSMVITASLASTMMPGPIYSGSESSPDGTPDITPLAQIPPCPAPQTVGLITTLPQITIVTTANSAATTGDTDLFPMERAATSTTATGSPSTNSGTSIAISISSSQASLTSTSSNGRTVDAISIGFNLSSSTTTSVSSDPSTSTSPSSTSDTFTITSVGPDPSTSTSTTSYVFNTQSTKNVAVYIGQTPVTDGTTLEAQCADLDIDIVILAFVVAQKYQGQYPLVNFGAAYSGQTQAMMMEAPGLLSCPELESYIEQYSTEATEFGNVLWQVFGPRDQIDIDLRPFRNVSIDGFDISRKRRQSSCFDVLGSVLRSNYATDSSKIYYLSSAPQCPFPDASTPMALILQCDFVWVQFYNNELCEVGSTGFNTSVRQWSSAIEASTMDLKPRLYVGAPAWSAAGPTAYTNIGTPEGMRGVAQQFDDMGLGNFGDVMFWDGPEGMLNVESGKDIISSAKEGLTGS